MINLISSQGTLSTDAYLTVGRSPPSSNVQYTAILLTHKRHDSVMSLISEGLFAQQTRFIRYPFDRPGSTLLPLFLSYRVIACVVTTVQ